MNNSSDKLYQFASQYLPGGVASSARIHKALGKPFYVDHAKGTRVYDVDGKEYLDMFMSYGAALLGHGNPAIKAALSQGLDEGFPCAYENAHQSRLAQCLTELVPSLDMLRFTLSGTETTYYVVKLAREFTRRPKVVKFEGHFHGFNDYLAYNYWPPAGKMWPAFTPVVEGVPESFQQEVIVLPFNDIERLEETLTQRAHEIAAVILEPVNYNSGGIRPLPGYLEKIRELTSKLDIILIFDEILSGFRTGTSCIQGYYGVTPDLCTLGKCLGGGMALSLFGGKKEIMSHVSPLGEAQHSGTYNGLWLPIMAGQAFIDVVSQPGFYDDLLARSDRLYKGINETMQRLGIQGRANGTGARFSFLFGPAAEVDPLVNYCDTSTNDWETTIRFYGKALERGIYFHSSWHEGISSMHTDADIDLALERIEDALVDLKKEGIASGPRKGGGPALF